MLASYRAGTITPKLAIYETLRPVFASDSLDIDFQGIRQ
jgi:hypothetical protein